MKNKIIIICVILATLLSLSTFVAILAQSNKDVNEPEQTEDVLPEDSTPGDTTPEDSTPKEETVTFSWDGTLYTVAKGTTIGEFVDSEEFNAVDQNDWRVEEGNVLCQAGLDSYCSSELVLVNGAIYGGSDSDFIYTAVNVCGESISIVPGTTWRQYLAAGDTTEQEICIISEEGTEVVVCHGQMAYVVAIGSEEYIHPDDVIDIGVFYWYN